jgi:type I restriction enzyme S subunit
LTAQRPGWKKVPLGSILSYLDERVTLQDEDEYLTITVKRRHGGLEIRERLFGHQIATKKQFRLVPGAFIISRVQCWHQAYAIVPDVQPNVIASVNYDQFAISPAIDAQFFWWLSHSPDFTETVRSSASGVVIEKMVFDRDAWLTKTVWLPPLAEQQRIVARIEGLSAQIEEGKALRKQAAAETEALLSSALSQACIGRLSPRCGQLENFGESARQLLVRISNVKWPDQVEARKRKPITLPQPPQVPESWLIVEAGELQECGAIFDIQDGNHGSDYPRKAEFGDQGVPFVTAKQINHGTVQIAEAPRLPNERAARLRIGFAKAGDVLLTHNASVGNVALSPEGIGDFLLGTSVTYWRCNPMALDRKYLFYFMRSEHFQGQLQFIMKQTTRNQVSVLKQVNLWILLPPLSEQRWIVAELDSLQAEVDKLKRLQTETAAELDALLPSILDKAFKGEL